MAEVKKILSIVASPVVSTAGAYVTGDALAAVLKVKDADLVANNTAIVQSVVIIDQAKQSQDLDVVFFSANPSTTTFTARVAADIADADMTKIVGIINVFDWYAFSDNSAGISETAALPITTTDGQFWIGLVARGTPTFTATTDIRVVINLLQEA